nr:immunoglobulin heavy chain junction region [Macaca mulatta]MOY21379.1 immunoglobulin heavy chain junction region [Macaca mulatta]MOY21403.1 immunoglobulin heavy chain junction region [Macaca mulatta]MOY21598.1 immunoglobulin heavy chain junction region [Macaca mulatta]MOY21720.1 immunoglobulin heavy chain junction region [Macaca mulatta]
CARGPSIWLPNLDSW